MTASEFDQVVDAVEMVRVDLRCATCGIRLDVRIETVFCWAHRASRIDNRGTVEEFAARTDDEVLALPEDAFYRHAARSFEAARRDQDEILDRPPRGCTHQLHEMPAPEGHPCHEAEEVLT